MAPRVRFAPSPTGYLHIGGARTALFNWLYARRHGGAFILRIEDTDLERSSADMVAVILDGLRWLGIDWDEGPDVGGSHGPYFQSQRVDRHREVAAALVTSGHAYYCYCRPEDLQPKREEAEAAGGAWKYDGTCRNLTSAEIVANDAAGLRRAVRFRVPAGETTFDDIVRGRIRVTHENLEDFVIQRSDGQPTFQLSNVVDDVDMAITHVVRGDDHISNTTKHVLIYKALGAVVPSFAHVPLIFGPDKKRLSKRHGATAVGEYATQGYVPEAMINFLALLGWSPGSGNEEVFSKAELIQRFALEGISGGNAVFNAEKLDWFNQQHISRLPVAELIQRIKPVLEDAGLWRNSFQARERDWFERVVNLVKPRVRRLTDFPTQLRSFVADHIDRDSAAVEKHLGTADWRALASEWRDRVMALDAFDAAAIETALRSLADERGVKAATLIHGTRVAVTGQTVSPGIFEVLELLGRDRTVLRLNEVLGG